MQPARRAALRLPLRQGAKSENIAGAEKARLGRQGNTGAGLVAGKLLWRAALLTCGLASIASGLPARGRLSHEVFGQGAWRLRIEQDLFSAGVACELVTRDRRAVYYAWSVGLRLPRNPNASGAVYRIDGAWPQASRADLPELIRLGAPFDRGTIENPTGGTLWVPYRKLVLANIVMVEASPSLPLTYYRLSGLSELLDYGTRRGCWLGSPVRP